MNVPALFFLAIFVAAAGSVSAETAARTPPSVTLELCGDLDAEEVQRILTVEYREQDYSKATVIVACDGDAATVRVLGPRNPRGQIVFIDLNGVAAVARPRVIALVAAELWAPKEPISALPLPAPPSLVEPDAPDPAPDPPLLAVYKERPSISVGLSLGVRDIEIYELGALDRTSHSSLPNWTIRGDVPIHRRFGVNGYWGSNFTGGSGGERSWDRFEFSAYVPVIRDRFTADVSAGFGGDEIDSIDIEGPEGYIDGPSYLYGTLALDLSYALNEQLIVAGKAAYLDVDAQGNSDDFGDSGDGEMWRIALEYVAGPDLRLDLAMESRNYGVDGARYSGASDHQMLYEVALSYLR